MKPTVKQIKKVFSVSDYKASKIRKIATEYGAFTDKVNQIKAIDPETDVAVYSLLGRPSVAIFGTMGNYLVIVSSGKECYFTTSYSEARGYTEDMDYMAS